jgi:hypothetical protein
VEEGMAEQTVVQKAMVVQKAAMVAKAILVKKQPESRSRQRL